MNIDVCMPLTPSNCRKLLLMRKVFKMTLSDDIEKAAERDLITQEQLDAKLPVQMTAPYFQDGSLLKFIQHAVDYDGRFVNVGSDPVKNLIASALYSIFVNRPLIVRDTATRCGVLRSLLSLANITHQTIKTDKDEFDPDVFVTFITTKDISDEFVAQTRSRTFHINPKYNDSMDRGNSLYGHVFGFSSGKPYNELVNEYYHSLISFKLGDTTNGSSPEQSSAVKLTNLGGVLAPLFPEVTFDKLLYPKRPVMESSQGVKILNPYHITKAFGAYYGLFNSADEDKRD